METARSRYSTPALVCGLLVLVPFVGFITLIPAIILGIMTLRDGAKAGRGSGWIGIIFGGGGLIICALAVILGIAGTLVNAAKPEAGGYSLSDGKLLMKAIKAAELDAATTGEEFYPADVKITQSDAFFDSLVKREYMSAKDLRSLKPHLLQVGNVASSDPRNTLVFVSKKGVTGPIVVGVLSGEVQTFETESEAGEFAKVPGRTPAFLP